MHADGVATIGDDGTPAEGETLTAGISDADGTSTSTLVTSGNAVAVRSVAPQRGHIYYAGRCGQHDHGDDELHR